MLGGVCHLRRMEFAGRRPYHFHEPRGSASLLVVIEHCVTLETYACAGLELEAMGFRRVRKAGGAATVEPRASASSDPVVTI